MNCQDWHALVKAPQNECGTSCQKEAYYEIIRPSPTPGCPSTGRYEPPQIKCNDTQLMNIRLIKCPPKSEPPIGLITRHQDAELIGSKFVRTCRCAARNGLDLECRRSSCRSNPACHMKPPRCWPQYKPQEKPEIKEIRAPVQLCYLTAQRNTEGMQECSNPCCRSCHGTR